MNEFESDWISLSQSFVQNGWIQDGRTQDGCHHQVESEWMCDIILIQHGRIQDGCHHQVESDWISLSQIKLVWVKSHSGVRVFMSISERRKQGVWIQHGRIS